MNRTVSNNQLYSKIAELLQVARQSVVRAVNQTMVYTYYEIGRMIVEDEQQGMERAEYGRQVLKELSVNLTTEFGRGFSQRNLEQMQLFYLTYSISQKSSAQLQKIENEGIATPDTSSPVFSPDSSTISSTDLTKSQDSKNESISATTSRKFNLSWSHYIKLMRIENRDERNFYEIESGANNWTLKQLQRQFDSGLYERLALSRDKEGIRKLAEKGQLIEKPLDFLKDPYVLEFLNLPEQQQYSESDLETAIIDKLEHFLLELGKGFTFVARQFRMTIDEKHFKVV